MKLSVLSLLAAFAFAAPLLARAGANPDFERDAKPILDTQPGLVHYVHSHYVVKETGVARVRGNGSQPPQPPFIFSARPRGSSGPFYLRLLIQPGPEGRVLKVADIRKVPNGAPEPTPAPETEETASQPEFAPAQPVTSEPIGNAPTPAPAAAPSDSNSSSTPQPASSGHSGPIID
jgi:hypothetical protein